MLVANDDLNRIISRFLQVWFSNRRAKWRRHQRLKLLQTTNPFAMHYPPSMQHAMAEVADREPMGRPRLPHRGEDHIPDQRGQSPVRQIAPPGFPIYLGYPRGSPYDMAAAAASGGFIHDPRTTTSISSGCSNHSSSPPPMIRLTPSPQHRSTPDGSTRAGSPIDVTTTPEIEQSSAATRCHMNQISPLQRLDSSTSSAASPPLTSSSTSSSSSSITTQAAQRDRRAKPSFSISEHAAFQPEPRPLTDDRQSTHGGEERRIDECPEKNRCLIISHVDANSDTMHS